MAAPTNGILDNFNRAYESPIGSPWQAEAGNLIVDSSQATTNSYGANRMLWGNTVGSDQEAFLTVAAFPMEYQDVALIFRSDGSGNEYWMGLVTMPSSQYYLYIAAYTSGDAFYTLVESSYLPIPSVGHRIWGTVVGNVLTLYECPSGSSTWTQRLQYTESTNWRTSGKIGMMIWESNARVDDFGGGTVSSGALKSITDSGHGSDSVSGVAVALGLTDAGHGSDAVPAGLQAALSASDSGSGTDILSALLAALTVAETGHGSDSVQSPAVAVPLTDSGAGADAISQVLAALALTDTGTGTDSAMAFILISVTDSGHGADGLSQVTITLSVNDSGVGTDTVPSAIVALTLADAGSAADGVSVGTSANFISVTDSGHGADEIAQIIATALVQELGVGAEAIRINAGLTVADSGAGADTASIVVAVPLTDQGAGLDSITQVLKAALISVADSAIGADTVTGVTVTVPLTDSGTGLDIVAALSAVLAVLDAGAGTDIVIHYDTTRTFKRVTVTFSGKHPGTVFSGKKLGIKFS